MNQISSSHSTGRDVAPTPKTAGIDRKTDTGQTEGACTATQFEGKGAKAGEPMLH